MPRPASSLARRLFSPASGPSKKVTGARPYRPFINVTILKVQPLAPCAEVAVIRMPKRVSPDEDSARCRTRGLVSKLSRKSWVDGRRSRCRYGQFWPASTALMGKSNAQLFMKRTTINLITSKPARPPASQPACASSHDPTPRRRARCNSNCQRGPRVYAQLRKLGVAPFTPQRIASNTRRRWYDSAMLVRISLVISC